MTDRRVERKLAAIFSADVKGYSRLMAQDEIGTMQALRLYRQILTDLIEKHKGRVIDTAGDNLLAEFGSVVDAMQCAVEVQNEIKLKNAAVPPDGRMEFRIGINLGDIVEEDGKIYGDGVNIAARLEGMADGGGICISGTAFDQVENKLPLGYEFLGECTFKNMAKPVRAYRVLTDAEAAGKVIGKRKRKMTRWWTAAMAILILLAAAAVFVWKYISPPASFIAGKEDVSRMLPPKPSIAVLPFTNLNGNKDQEYFCDGLTEDLITALSKAQRLLVIARNSTAVYKGKTATVHQVAQDLGVRYVVEGNVQRDGDRVRITVQLIDTGGGHHLWAERYDYNMKDLFALQSAITLKILVALQAKLLDGEQAFLRGRGTTNLGAYEKAYQATELLHLASRASTLRARQLCEEAIGLDPGYAFAYALLSHALLAEVRSGWAESPTDAAKRAYGLTQKAFALEPDSLIAQMDMGMIELIAKNFDAAIGWGWRAVTAHPNADNAYAYLAWFFVSANKPQEAVSAIQQAIQRNPYPPGWYYSILGGAYWMMGRHREAILELKKAVTRSPDNLPPRLQLTVAYVEADRLDEARTELNEALRIEPFLTRDLIEKSRPDGNQTYFNRYMAALKEAGMK